MQQTRGAWDRVRSGERPWRPKQEGELPRAAGTEPDPGLDEGAYVTDGKRLFRVVQPINPPRAVRSAVLEDCMTLDLHSYAATTLWEMGLRVVMPPADWRR
jgi:hypothetical protein